MQYIEKENFRDCFPIGEKRMEKLFILTFLLTVVLTIPGFLCSVILLIVAKQWKWLALTLGNLLFFLFPERRVRFRRFGIKRMKSFEK